MCKNFGDWEKVFRFHLLDVAFALGVEMESLGGQAFDSPLPPCKDDGFKQRAGPDTGLVATECSKNRNFRDLTPE